LLILWPVLLFCIPIQDWLVQLIGLRGSIFLLPFLLSGRGWSLEERYQLALWLAAFNIAAFVFAGIEFFVGGGTVLSQERGHILDLQEQGYRRSYGLPDSLFLQ